LEHSKPDENSEMLIDQFYHQVSKKSGYPDGEKTFFPEIELLERAFGQTPTPEWEAIEKNCYQHPHDPHTFQQLDDALAYLKNKQILNQLKICDYNIPFSRFLLFDEVQPEGEERKKARIEKLQVAEKEYAESEVFRSRFVQLHQMLQTLHPTPLENSEAEQRFKELTVLESLLAREQDNPVLRSISSESKNTTN
ncbi:MAG: hypothetical protein K2X66_15155, partial [Cyanobacteria bacterium]|nr:hypothetical protein [Cyanobacteriota bacterium]